MTILVRAAAVLLFAFSGCAPAPPIAPKAGSVAVEGGTLAYREAGAGPALVLLHGGDTDGRMWETLVPRLAERHRVIAVDARGHGASTAPAGPQPQMIEDLRRLLDALGVSRATLAGFSMGGGTATGFTLRHPERVERLVLLSTGGPPPGAPQAGPGPHNPEGRRLLAQSRVPVLALIGSRDSARIRETGEAIAAEIQGARLLRLEGASHDLVLEQPETVTCALLSDVPQRCQSRTPSR